VVGEAGNAVEPIALPGATPTAVPPAAAPVAAPAVAPVAAAAPTVTDPNVITRTGNSYTGGPNIGANAVIQNPDGTARQPGAPISAQNQMAAQNLNDNSLYGAGTIGRQVQRQMDADKYTQEQAALNAASAAQGGALLQQQLEGRALRGDRGAIAMLQSRMGEATARRGQDLTAASQSAAHKLAEQKQGIEAQTNTLDNAAKVQLQSAALRLVNAKTAEERVAAEDNYRALQGKYEKPVPQAKFTVVPGAKNLDGSQDAPVVLDAEGKVLDLTSRAKPLPPGLVVGAPTKQADGIYPVGGKSVTIKSGKVTEIK
jgi:hypothetical protein